MTATEVVLSLETLHWTTPQAAPGPLGYAEFTVGAWPVFFRIDGSSVRLSDADDDTRGMLVGTATTRGTSGTGLLPGKLRAGGVVAIPPETGRWADRVEPIPIAVGLEKAGVFGVVAVVFDPGAVDAEALRAGHARLNEAVAQGLNDLIPKLGLSHPDPDQDDIDELSKRVKDAVEAAARATMSTWEKVENWVVSHWFEQAVPRFDQNDLPAGDFDQHEFASNIAMPYLPGEAGIITVSGSISRSRRDVGQGRLDRFDHTVLAIAGYAGDDDQHAIVATDDGTVTELWWPPAGPVGRGSLAQFARPIKAIAGYWAVDGSQHVIVATDDRAITELWWRGGEPVGRGALPDAAHPVLALAGYGTADGAQHVIVATEDGTVTEYWWSGAGSVEQNTLSHFAGRIVDVAGYYAADGSQHVIVLTHDGTLTELWWTGPGAVGAGELARVDAYPWNRPIGVGGFFAAGDREHHVLVGMSNGPLREFHWAPGDSGDVRHDDLAAVTGPIGVDAYVDAGGVQHVLAATASGEIREFWWSPAWTAVLQL